MKKQELLKQIYKIIGGRDMLEQDELFDLQEVVYNEIVEEAEKGSMKIRQYGNGYIFEIKIPTLQKKKG